MRDDISARTNGRDSIPSRFSIARCHDSCQRAAVLRFHRRSLPNRIESGPSYSIASNQRTSKSAGVATIELFFSESSRRFLQTQRQRLSLALRLYYRETQQAPARKRGAALLTELRREKRDEYIGAILSGNLLFNLGPRCRLAAGSFGFNAN